MKAFGQLRSDNPLRKLTAHGKFVPLQPSIYCEVRVGSGPEMQELERKTREVRNIGKLAVQLNESIKLQCANSLFVTVQQSDPSFWKYLTEALDKSLNSPKSP